MNLMAQRRLGNKLEDPARGEIVNYMIGKNITNDALCHHSKGPESNACILCGAKDGRWHRLLDCTALDDIRKNTNPQCNGCKSNMRRWGILELCLTIFNFLFPSTLMILVKTRFWMTMEDNIIFFPMASATLQRILLWR